MLKTADPAVMKIRVWPVKPVRVGARVAADSAYAILPGVCQFRTTCTLFAAGFGRSRNILVLHHSVAFVAFVRAVSIVGKSDRMIADANSTADSAHAGIIRCTGMG